ncbi:transcription termination factor MTERF15, mitochondrial-like [Herrania umbratica]|uniref:Transcription termination factor MTERF15, mitochondrial-like n=1 Tax=Herrania umbratica TaxID=108875 RepID=A0A6J1ATF0_9ROSI|nr:transcription termination factor MTERF15, mitochondrial-like [Herrania umbratica]XP_021290501.1 transcription termination factor MTERF15, mitochondrial-like [Herrania umbratica]XP_021290502.1 transcription termination factor MTERF15, mitochondrial-like [Herrania umbratica]
MFNLSRKNNSILHRVSYIVRNNSSSNSLLFLKVRCISNTCSDLSQSFAYSYLIDKFGFSQESALAASTYLCFKTPDKADSVTAFLEKHGFSRTQIQQMIRLRPNLLSSNVEKTLLPKLEFFRSRGVSSPDLIKFLLNNPTILTRSLANQVVPCFNHLSSLLQSDDKAVKAIKRYPRLVTCNFDAHMLPNINILLDNGVPESHIRTMFFHHPRYFVMIPDRFKEIVKEVKEMGFDPLLMKFLRAVIMFRKMSKPTLERKFDVYKKWGWSEQEIWEAIRKNPQCVDFSEETIMSRMDFLVNRMGFKPLHIANQPSVLCRSLEKRIIPRGLYTQELLSKGLTKKFTLSGLFDISEKTFFERFINRYEDIAPQLLKLYKEKVKLAIGGKY